MTSPSRDISVRLAVTALTLALLTGCGDGGEPDADPTGTSSTPSESNSESPSESPGESSTSEATSTPEPTAEPASGRRIRTPSFSFNAPEEWVAVQDSLPFINLERDPGSKRVLRQPHGIISVNALPSGRSFTLDQAANRSDSPGKRLADIALDGVRVYHFSDSTSLDSQESYGVVTDDFLSLSITFRLFGSTRAEREALAESVLATWEWQS